MNKFKIEKLGNYKLQNGVIVKINCILNNMCMNDTGQGVWYTKDGKSFTSNEISFKYNIVKKLENDTKRGVKI